MASERALECKAISRGEAVKLFGGNVKVTLPLDGSGTGGATSLNLELTLDIAADLASRIKSAAGIL